MVTKAVNAFRQYLPCVRKISLVAGRITNSASIAKALDVEVNFFPGIDYIDPAEDLIGNSKEESRKLALKLASDLLKNFGSESSVWWIHNYHLGKNPLFTEALLQIIQSGSPQKMIFHIHDFPECGRFQNLDLLNRVLTFSPYPISPHLHYAVLNARDWEILIKAGMPSDRVSLLENPLSPFVPEKSLQGRNRSKKALKVKLAKAFSHKFPSFKPQAPLLFYPVRAIRRKNLLEAALITKLLKDPVNLMVTLPGISKPERVYSSMVERIYRNGLLKGLWGIGAELDKTGLQFEDLIGASDLVLSSSIQEGFGYLFINTLQWRLPLIARDLDILVSMKKLFNDYPAYFYKQVLIPLKAEDKKDLIFAYDEKLKNLTRFLPENIVTELKEDIHNHLQEEFIDFSYLSKELQYQILQDLVPKKTYNLLHEINQDLLNIIEEYLLTAAPDKNTDVEKRFGYKKYALAFGKILEFLSKGSKVEYSKNPDEIKSEILRQFAQKEYLRLLYD